MILLPQVPQSVVDAMSDLGHIGQPIAWAVVAYFLRDIYRDHKDLRNGVYGKDGLNERLARLEGASEVHQP